MSEFIQHYLKLGISSVSNLFVQGPLKIKRCGHWTSFDPTVLNYTRNKSDVTESSLKEKNYHKQEWHCMRQGHKRNDLTVLAFNRTSIAQRFQLGYPTILLFESGLLIVRKMKFSAFNISSTIFDL